MVSRKETTPAAYLASLPPAQREVIAAVRALVNARLPEGYVETMNWGMLSWEVPLSRYPDTYNKQPLSYIGLAAQKNVTSLYLTSVYGDAALLAQLQEGFRAAGHKLDMGKSCIRFKRIDDVPLDVLGDIIAATSVETMIERAEAARRR